MIEVLVHDAPTEREAAPLLLDALKARNPKKAEWIEDVYSEVLKGLRQDDIKDPEMVNWLMDAIMVGLNEVAPADQRLDREGDSYGYISIADMSSRAIL